MRSGAYAVKRVLKRGVGAGEVDDHLRPVLFKDLLEGPLKQRVRSTHELHVSGLIDGGAHRLAHPPGGAGHSYANHDLTPRSGSSA